MRARAAVHAKSVPASAVVAAAAGALRTDETTEFTPEERRRMIAEAAYYLAERRGFEPGYEVEDWLAAEAEVDRNLETAQLAVAAT
jgi:hypothetical protein